MLIRPSVIPDDILSPSQTNQTKGAKFMKLSYLADILSTLFRVILSFFSKILLNLSSLCNNLPSSSPLIPTIPFTTTTRLLARLLTLLITLPALHFLTAFPIPDTIHNLAPRKSPLKHRWSPRTVARAPPRKPTQLSRGLNWAPANWRPRFTASAGQSSQCRPCNLQRRIRPPQ